MTDMLGSPTRRTLLSLAVGAGTMAAVGGSIAAPAGAHPGRSTEWDVAMRDLIDAQRILAQTGPAYTAADAARQATAPNVEHVDWQGLEGITPHPGQIRHIDTVKCRKDTLRHIEAGYWRHNPEHPRRRLAALDQLDAYRAAVAENERRHASVYGPAVEANEAAVVRVDLCEARLMEMPAPHGQALLWKIDHLVHDEGDGTTPSWTIGYAEPMLRDALRLLQDVASPKQSAPSRYSTAREASID